MSNVLVSLTRRPNVHFTLTVGLSKQAAAIEKGHNRKEQVRTSVNCGSIQVASKPQFTLVLIVEPVNKHGTELRAHITGDSSMQVLRIPFRRLTFWHARAICSLGGCDDEQEANEDRKTDFRNDT